MRKLFFICIVFTLASCGSNDEAFNVSEEKTSMVEKYPEVPKEEFFTDTTALTKSVLAELLDRYKTNLTNLNKAVTSNGATLVVSFLTPEVGNSATASQKQGKPIIENFCKELNIPFYDLTTKIATMDATVVTQMPKDGHWSKEGAKIIADELKPIIDKYTDIKSTVTFADAKDHKVYGDLTPNENSIKDGGKNMPYKVKINAQGLRMDANVDSVKTKQRVLLMGDSEFFFPFLDNEFTGSAILQSMYPQKEILNSAMWGYTIEDYLSLYNEKAKYAQPDVVIVETSGNDILDFYFTQRNKLSRTKVAAKPSPNELKYYETKYSKK